MSQRQRDDGRWPSGNTAGTAAPTSTTGITNTTLASQVNHAVSGQPPPEAMLPAEYPPLNTPTANRVPEASSSQPMRFVGTRATRNAPTPATDAIVSVNKTVASGVERRRRVEQVAEHGGSHANHGDGCEEPGRDAPARRASA